MNAAAWLTIGSWAVVVAVILWTVTSDEKWRSGR